MKPDRSGLYAGLSAYVLWGLMPLLFQASARAGASPFEIVAWRSIWSVPVAFAVVAATRRLDGLRQVFAHPKTLVALACSAVLIGSNWCLYVWAVNNGHVLATSLGYYINPILNMIAGAVLFGERMDRTGYAAAALATLGVLIQTAAVGAFPWISVTLALSFCAYGIVRKQVRADAQTGLTVECLLLLTPGLAYVAWELQRGAGVFGHSAPATAWLVAGGPATVLPLLLFAVAARKLPLTTLGFLQFIGPTMGFAIGVAGGEPLSPLRLLSFAFIWAGVLAFAAGAWRRSRRLRAASIMAEA